MTLFIYTCPEKPDFFEIQVHDHRHNIVAAALIQKQEIAARLADERANFYINLLSWEALAQHYQLGGKKCVP